MVSVEYERSKVESELDEPIWAVISFERIEATNLAYKEAADLISELESNSVPGLCIVTDKAASRLKPSPT